MYTAAIYQIFLYKTEVREHASHLALANSTMYGAGEAS
jgi:hypothetical protein